MKNIFLILICMCLPFAAFSQNVEKMNMVAGQTELLRGLKVDRISIGNPGVIDVESLDKTSEILVQALNPGFSDLRLWKDGVMKQFIVEVVDVNLSENLKNIESALSNVEGLTIRSIGNQVLIEGDVYRPQDIEKVTRIAESFENVVSLVSKPNLDLQNIVSIDVRFVEISKNAIKNIGINWDDAFGFLNFGFIRDIGTNNLFRINDANTAGDFLDALGEEAILPLDLGSSSSRFLGISSRVSAVVDLLETNGYAKILAEPTLSCVSGGEASFLAGGQVPLPVFTDNQQSVTFRDYGVRLDVEPIADSFGNISTKIDFEISDIDPSVTVQGIPGFLTRSTSTEMNVRAGETIVISGLFTGDKGKDVDKVAGLGDIPILGELFKSRSFRNNETEMYLFLTPHLIDSQSQANFDALDRAEELEEESEKELKINLFD